MPNLRCLLAGAILCTSAGATQAVAEPSDHVAALVACMAGEDYTASDDCADALKTLAIRDASVGADSRVHRAFAARLLRDVEYFEEWQRSVATMTQEELERDSPEYEDGTSAMLLADTIRLQLLPHAGPDTQPVLFEALLSATVMNGDMERGLARYGRRAVVVTLDFAGSSALNRRGIAYSVLGWMLDLESGGSLDWPLSSSEREAAARAITAGLQEAEPSLRLLAIHAAKRGRVAGALPMLRVLAVTLPDDEPYRLRRAAADAVAHLLR